MQGGIGVDWNWLQSLIFGFLSGFSEFLPVSSEAHQILFVQLTGAGNEVLGFRLLCHVAMLVALLLSCRPHLSRLARERRLSGSARRKRKRQPDVRSVFELRILRTAAFVVLLSFVEYPAASTIADTLWILALVMTVNGIILFLPQFFPSGNKEAQSMSALDALVTGLGGALAVLPGISRIGCMNTAGRLRGCDGRYIVDIALLLCIPALVVLIGFDIYGIFIAESIFSLSLILHYILATAAAFAGAYFGIVLLRFLAVRVGFAGFAYYCWGVALFTFILYLTI